MEKELAKKLVAACIEFDVEATIREDYSGRGMVAENGIDREYDYTGYYIERVL